MLKSLYQTADTGDTLSDSGCRSLQETLYQTADAGESGQKYIYQTADAGISIPDSGCSSLPFRQWMQESL